ncbi:hypothetical protein FI667_g9380, partial [Globisporangium splendens]
MLLYDSVRRMTIVEAVEHLKTFADQEIVQNKAADGASVNSEFNLEKELVPGDSCTIEEFMAILEAQCRRSQPSRTSVLHIYERLDDVYERLHEVDSSQCYWEIPHRKLNSENPNPKYKRIDLDGSTSSQEESLDLPWLIQIHQLEFDTDENGSIGSGGFGKVFKATWLGTPVVVKYMGDEDQVGKSIPQEHLLHEI